MKSHMRYSIVLNKMQPVKTMVSAGVREGQDLSITKLGGIVFYLLSNSELNLFYFRVSERNELYKKWIKSSS